MKTIRIAVLLTAMLAMATAAHAETWTIDASHSSVDFKVRHFFAKTAGGFADFSGTIVFDAENPDASSVEATVVMASLNTNNEDRDNHLRSEDFFAVETYPTMEFKSTKVAKDGDDFVATGELTLHGVTQTVDMNFEFLGAGPDAWGGVRAGFTATMDIDRKAFGISWNKTLDQGGTVLGEKVAVSIEIEAVQQQEESR